MAAQNKQIALEHYQSQAAQATGLHPIFGRIVSDFMALSAYAAPSNLQAHYPEVGRRRAYRSLGDAMAYEAGFLAYSQDADAPAERTPFADGWWDAFAAEESRNQAANERHMEDES